MVQTDSASIATPTTKSRRRPKPMDVRLSVPEDTGSYYRQGIYPYRDWESTVIGDVSLETTIPRDVYNHIRTESAKQHRSINELLVTILRDHVELRSATERERYRLDYLAREQEARSILKGVD